MICEQGDIVSLNFDPSRGHEPAGRHFAVVISPWKVNSVCSLTLLAPITSRDNGYPLHVPVAAGNDVYGFVQCEALRSVDLDSRGGTTEVVGFLDDETLSEVLTRIRIVVGLE